MTEGRPDERARAALERLEDRLLGGPRTLTLAELAEQAGAELAEVRLFWHALGQPTTGPDDVAYTEADADALRTLVAAARDNELSDRTTVSLVRSIGHTTDRLVTWQVEALVEHLAARHGLSDAQARVAVIDRLAEIADLLEGQLVHAWRRQLVAVAQRFAAEFGVGGVLAPQPDGLPLARAVGFADIVSFTSRTMHLAAPELATFVQDFEAQARDVVTDAGGRVVKTIGDAVLFVADDLPRGASVALGLAEAFGTGTRTPVRVGMVWGRLLSRFGDVFGPSVVLASRLTDAAEPGTVMVDRRTADLLTDVAEDADPGHPVAWRVEGVAPVEMQGLGAVEAARLRRS